MSKPDLQLNHPIQIGSSLILRRSTSKDSEPLAEFNARIHGDNPADGQRVAQWTRDLINGQHPTHAPDDFTLVVEKKSGRIVSAMNLISQVWQYDGIPIKVGRPELVGTDPEYRRKGLVRRQFEIVHAWSKSRGEVMQGITGIPHYYRQFGYEMTAELDIHWIGYVPTLPALKKDEPEPFKIRSARESDLGFISRAYNLSIQHLRLSCVRDEDWWRYELLGKHPESVARLDLKIIEDPSRKKVGFFAQSPFLHDGYTSCQWFALLPGTDWSAVTPVVLRHLASFGQALAKEKNENFAGYELALSSDHPAALVQKEHLPKYLPPYAWYLRVPDLVAFLQLISPALESHLVNSNCAGYIGDLQIGDYLNVITLTFLKGHITSVQSRPQVDWKDCDVAFPMLTFLHILFGYRSLEDLRYAFIDCRVTKKDKRALVEALFPVKTSQVFPIQ